ncbi:hypothetical protein SAMN04487969_102496 [Paenibacillus algorifonticola]|uniref:Dit-like phage tail protein N-terminal domain-containing protein n=1 Tax=Paenibacillus algorifonticola TaxID=684063 RepID=A0A1I2AHU8_9BACL|nr:hypothetical protein [Paenibacillus algorifonticola]SFE43349.1 hypothetical protein SAMN04487969_102496 [Paenibacillus algorifonticola]
MADKDQKINPILDLNAPNIRRLVYLKTNIGGWFMDAFIRSTHTSRLKITSHPTQVGANVTDHAYLEPRELVMEVGMTDVAKSIIKGQFTGGYSRSVQAFKVLKALQASRVPIQVHTRLGTYQNMLIEVISAPDDYKTMFGLRCTVTMRELLVAQVKTVKISARPTVTSDANRGVQESQQPNQSLLSIWLEQITGNSAISS